MAENIFPTNYSTKATPDWTDVVWSSDAVTNFNLTIASIALYTLTNSTTDDVVEWTTNLYYTTARVTTDTAWKADKTNVLEKDNTTAYTPTEDYHPATKLYVDWMWTNINWLTQKTNPVDADEFIIYDSVWLENKKTTLWNIKTELENLYVFPWNTTTYYSQWSVSVPLSWQTFSYTFTKSWTYKVSYSISQSWAGSWWNFSIDIDSNIYPIWSTDSILNATLRKKISFSAWESTSENYFITVNNWQTINFVFDSQSWVATQLNSITITWT
jgi:hypothetical protein